jgi:hypothetical protein
MSNDFRAAIAALALFATIASACARNVVLPQSTTTQVDLSRKNYNVVRSNAVGASRGFSLLGVVPIIPTSYTNAMSDLYEEAGMKEGKAQALVNVNQETATLYLVVFSLPKLTVRADIIEFTGE